MQFRYLLILFLLLAFHFLTAQKSVRFIIMEGTAPSDQAIELESERLQTDFRLFFNIEDIKILRPSNEADKSKGEYSTISEGLQILRELSCPGEGVGVAIVFLFPEHNGPSAIEIHQALKDCPEPPKILANSYFRSDLEALACSRYSVFDYARGFVNASDSLRRKDKVFPILPVGIGTVVTAGTLLILSRDKENPCEVADASWVPPAIVCSGGSLVQLTASGTQGGEWSGTGVTTQGTFDPSFGTQDVTYAAGEGECRVTQTHTISVISPDASWTGPLEACEGETITLQPSQTGGEWSGDGVTVNPDGTANFTQEASGTYEATYSFSESSCTDVVSMNITVIPDADANWTIPEDLCTGNEILLEPNATTGGTWSGDHVTDLGNGTASFQTDSEGIYSVSYTAGEGECQSVVTQDIEVFPAPDAAWTSPGTPCVEEVIVLSPSGDQGGTWSGENITDLGDGTAQFSASTSGSFTVTYTVTVGPCTASHEETIEVVEKADPSWSIPGELCSGEAVVLTPDGTMGGTWSGQDITELGDGTASFEPGESGDYQITYTVGEGACADSLTKTVNVGQTPDASWSPPDFICVGESVNLIPVGTQGGQWTGNGVTDIGDGTAIFQQDDAGSFSVTYSVTLGSCSSSQTDTLVVGTLPDPSWTVPTDVCTDQEIILEPDGTPGGTWSGEGVTDNGNGTATFFTDEAGNFSVTYSVGQGECQQMSTQDIMVLESGDPSWIPPATPLCPGEVFDLEANAGDWSGEHVTNFGDGTGQFQSFDSGSFPVTLTVGEGVCSQSETHAIEVQDDTAPEILTPPQDLVIECDGEGNTSDIQSWLDDAGGASASDNCGSVTWENDFTGVPFDCGMAGSVTVTFTAFDESGNATSTFATIFIEDNNGPELQGVPADIFTSCDNIPDPAQVIAVDHCSGVTDVIFTEEIIGGCPYDIIRTWTATDDCGNATTGQQTVTVTDDEAPSPTFVPPDMEIECPGPPETCIPPVDPAQFSDNCDPDPIVEFFEEQMPISPTELMIIRCWTAFDNCENASDQVCQQIFIFMAGTLAGNEIPEATSMIAITITPVLPYRAAPEPGIVETIIASDWHDPGQVAGNPIGGYNGRTYGPGYGLFSDLNFNLNPVLSIRVSAGYSVSGFVMPVSLDNQGQKVLHGVINQINNSGELRMSPFQTSAIFLRTGLRYDHQVISNATLTAHGRSVNLNQPFIAADFRQFAGAGITIPLPAGDLEASGTWWGRQGNTLQLQFRMRFDALFRSKSKHP